MARRVHFILLLLLLAYHVLNSAIVVAQLNYQIIYEYVMPIEIRDVSGRDWKNKTILIELNSTNFRDWDLLSYDGSNIYVTDKDGNPLYFWIDIFDKHNRKAFIYVKLPYLPANSSTTIYLHYGVVTHKYREYNNPAMVFDWLDDFETGIGIPKGWQHYGPTTYGLAGWVDSDVAFHGKFALEKFSYDDQAGIYRPLGFTLNETFVLEAWIYRSRIKHGYSDRIGVVDDNGNGYGIAIVHTRHDHSDRGEAAYAYVYSTSLTSYGVSVSCTKTGMLAIDVRNNWLANTYANTPLLHDPYQEWYLARLIWYSNGRIVAEVYDVGGNLLGRIEYTDTRYNTFTSVYIFGDSIYYVDLIRVWQAIDPYPEIVFRDSFIVPVKVQVKWMTPITVVERGGVDLYNYAVRIELNSTNFDGWDHVQQISQTCTSWMRVVNHSTIG